jgi:DNA-binding transcriptional ArsR family regulator
MRTETRRQITDIRALRALADPIRYRIMGHLMAVGPQTASQCAEIVGATPSNCSYHLRELARYGLVERVERVERGESGVDDGRERPWRPTATGFSYGVPDSELADPAAALANRQLLHAGVDDEAALAHAAVEQHADLPSAWREAETMATYGLLVDPVELTALYAAVDALIRPYIALTREDAPGDARAVHVGFSAFRRPGS